VKNGARTNIPMFSLSVPIAVLVYPMGFHVRFTLCCLAFDIHVDINTGTDMDIDFEC
jgi:hypothetical protein